MTQSRSIIAVLILHLIGSPAIAQPRAAKVDRLELGLRTIEESARNDRQVAGSGMLMLAAAGGTAAVFASQSANAGFRSSGPWTFGVLGLLFAVAGTAYLVSPRENETLPEKFRLMPERSSDDLKAKTAFGEKALTTLSERGRRERFWFGAGAVTVGLSFVLLYAADTSALAGSTLYLGGFSLFLGVVAFTTQSTAEEEMLKYTAEGSGLALNSWGVAPIPNGAILQTAWRF